MVGSGGAIGATPPTNLLTDCDGGAMVFCHAEVWDDKPEDDDVVVKLPTDNDDVVVEDIDFSDELIGFINPSARDVVV